MVKVRLVQVGQACGWFMVVLVVMVAARALALAIRAGFGGRL